MSLPVFSEIPGIRFGKSPVEVQIDLFFDLQCPYSKVSWDVIGESIMGHWSDQLNIYFHPICLSHHRQSWDLTRTLSAIRSLEESRAAQFIDLVYSDHEQFYNARWKSRNEDEFLEHLVEFIRPPRKKHRHQNRSKSFPAFRVATDGRRPRVPD